jgi:hypothetical protein
VRFLVGRIVVALFGFAVAIALMRLFPPLDQTEELVEVSIAAVLALYVDSIVHWAQIHQQLKTAQDQTAAALALVAEHGAGEPLTTLFMSAQAQVPATDFPGLYLKVLWAIDGSYHTTFVASKQEAEFGHNAMALEIQRSKVIVNGADIKRLFICRDVGELDELKQLMLEQAGVGIKVRYILRETLRTNQILREWQKKVQKLDFAIIDRAWVLFTDVDNDSYRIRGARLSGAKDQREELEDFYSTLWQEAKDPAVRPS